MTDVAKAVARAIKRRRSASQAIAGWIYYALLPEAINREMAGQGLIGWVKMSIYDPLVRRCKGVRKTAISINIVPQQGAVMTLEFVETVTMAEAQAQIELETGIRIARHSLIVAEQPAASVVVRGADAALSPLLRSVSLALNALSVTKSCLVEEREILRAFGPRDYAMRVLQGAVAQLVHGEVPITIHVPSSPGGHTIMLDVPSTMTIADLTSLIQKRQEAAALDGGPAFSTGNRITMMVTPPRRSRKSTFDDLNQIGSPLSPIKVVGSNPSVKAPTKYPAKTSQRASLSSLN